MDLDKIFVLNLTRRPERRAACIERLEKLGLSDETWSRIEFIDAVDGQLIDQEYMTTHGYGLWPHWRMAEHKLPFYCRDIKKGEIGCALSHVKAWRRAVRESHREVMILEDDVIFSGDFVSRLNETLQWLRTSQQKLGNWDLLYAGRQQILSDKEVLTDFLVRPGYSYCAHAYVLSQAACTKLLSVGYERDLIAVDEFLPAMFHQHPRRDVAMRFRPSTPLSTYAITPNIALQANTRDSDTEQSTYYATNENSQLNKVACSS